MTELAHHRLLNVSLIAHVQNIDADMVLGVPKSKQASVLSGEEHLSPKQLDKLKSRFADLASSLPLDIFGENFEAALQISISDEQRIKESQPDHERAKKRLDAMQRRS